ncbi:coiled-coil domain containing 53 isoform X2 [Lycorma delicatula]|uniref:coiled-coil domain containing 53 isoform X2 n=1 Tax=Lycorma delicatula TaxID=130591 RepID=UPI003F51A29C
MKLSFSEVPQINKKRLLTFLNDFIITTVSFLNNFAQSCESRLHNFEMKMQKLEAELCIIETKLNSIPGLEVNEVESSTNVNITNLSTTNNVPPSSSQPSGTEDKSSPDVIDKVTDIGIETQSPAATTASQNPELAKYFKMLQLGVPAQAVKLEMGFDGCDPNLLDQ